MLLFICLFLFLFSQAGHAQPEAELPDTPTGDDDASDQVVDLATNISSAFASDLIANNAHNLLPQLQCIFNNMERKFNVQVIPWRRAYQDVKSNRIDGFFTAIPMRQVDPYATLSAPLLLENWYWFWRVDTVAPESWRAGYRLGSISGSQQETWLGEAGYTLDMSALNLPQLISLLQTRRIDVVLADRESFIGAAKQLNINPEKFQSRFFRYVPLGVYFNEQFLDHNPDFLNGFNREIVNCATTRFVLSDFERQQIKTLFAHKIEYWKRLPKMDALLKHRNLQSRSLSNREITRRDNKWRKAFTEADTSYPFGLVDKELSAQLRDIIKQSLNCITEIIITDARGLNVAVSGMTSDYWQGDEKQFTEAFNKPAATFYLDEINYDESTKRFQVELSIPIYSEDSRDALGVMIIGLDVEKVLSLAN